VLETGCPESRGGGGTVGTHRVSCGFVRLSLDPSGQARPTPRAHIITPPGQVLLSPVVVVVLNVVGADGCCLGKTRHRTISGVGGEAEACWLLRRKPVTCFVV
jgi:hypothetical protein